MSELADQQHGYVARSQLLAIGVSRSAIARRTDLIPSPHKGVYGVGHLQRTPIALAHAAVLACGHEGCSATTRRRRCGVCAAGRPRPR